MHSMTVFAGLAALTGLASANFHITSQYNTVLTGPTSQDHYTTHYACPSNKWNCDCYAKGHNGARVDGFGTEKMKVHGMCGVGDMDLYIDSSNHNNYKMYISGGDGKQIGYCAPSHGTKECGLVDGSQENTDGWVCDTYVCGT